MFDRVLTLSWRESLSYRNQSTDLLSKPIDWFPHDRGLRYERVNSVYATKREKHFGPIFPSNWGTLGLFREWFKQQKVKQTSV